jgi:hypothetical protein
MTFSSTPGDRTHMNQENRHDTQQALSEQVKTTIHPTLPNHDTAQHAGSSLGLLHDDKLGSQPTDSKDVTILRRLKVAILEGQHPYFKANVDLSNLQDLVLTSGSRSANSVMTSTQESSHPDTTMARSTDQVPSVASLVPTNISRSPVRMAVDSRIGEGKDTSEANNDKNLQSGMTKVHVEDVKMAHFDIQEVAVDPEESGKHAGAGLSGNSTSENLRAASQTLGRYALHSPIESESNNREFYKFFPHLSCGQ